MEVHPLTPNTPPPPNTLHLQKARSSQDPGLRLFSAGSLTLPLPALTADSPEFKSCRCQALAQKCSMKTTLPARPLWLHLRWPTVSATSGPSRSDRPAPKKSAVNRCVRVRVCVCANCCSVTGCV